jgi:predicted DsbA family dithiol-disulfide isomerase
VGKRNLEAALEALDPTIRVKTAWHSFELDPSAPKALEASPSYVDRLATKYGTTPAQAQGMLDRMVGMGKKLDIPFDFRRIRPGNTFDAHRLLHFAKAHRLCGELKERLLAAYHCEGVAVSDANELLRLCGEVGLDVDAASAVLNGDDFSVSVREDEAAAHSLGVRGVPFFVIGRYGVSGAQPPELLTEILRRAQKDDDAEPEVPDGEVCTPESR